MTIALWITVAVLAVLLLNVALVAVRATRALERASSDAGYWLGLSRDLQTKLGIAEGRVRERDSRIAILRGQQMEMVA